jgi:hypothetical protein
MRWDYNVEVVNMVADSNGDYYPYGIKITKTLYDDSNQVVVKVDTDIEDAKQNAGPDFIVEFFDTAKQIFVDQVSTLFNYSGNPNYSISGPSRAITLGMEMHKALSAGMSLLG